MSEPLSEAWDRVARRWIEWVRTPGHDSYWRFHRRRLLELVPEPRGLTIDLGCGEGRVGRDLAARGHTVVGVDASITMVRACIEHPRAEPALCAAADRLPIRDDVADLVVAFMSLHDIDDLEGAVSEAARVLVGGGRLHLAIVHPVNSAGEFDGRDGSAPFTIIGSYTEAHRYVDEVERDGLTMTFHGWHRPLAAYTAALTVAGFVIERLEEVGDPDPTDRWARLPLFLHVVARLDDRRAEVSRPRRR